MDLRSVSIITRNIVASRTESDLLQVVCTHLVQTCGATAAAAWLTHRNRGMSARPDHWASTRIPPHQQSLLIEQNHVVGGLRGTGPYLKKIQALPPINETLQYIAAPLVFDGGIRGLLAAWIPPEATGGLPDLIDLASQLTAVRLRALFDAGRLVEQAQSIQDTQRELDEHRRKYLQEEQAATSGYLAALISQAIHQPLGDIHQSLVNSQAALRNAPPLAQAAVNHARQELERIQSGLATLGAILGEDPQLAELTRADATVNLAELAARLCLRNGFKLDWTGDATATAASRNGGPAIFRALLLELFPRMQTNQRLHIHAQHHGEHSLWGFSAGALTPELERWVQTRDSGVEADARWSAALKIAHLLTRHNQGLLRFTPRELPVVGAVLRLPAVFLAAR